MSLRCQTTSCGKTDSGAPQVGHGCIPRRPVERREAEVLAVPGDQRGTADTVRVQRPQPYGQCRGHRQQPDDCGGDPEPQWPRSFGSESARATNRRPPRSYLRTRPAPARSRCIPSCANVSASDVTGRVVDPPRGAFSVGPPPGSAADRRRPCPAGGGLRSRVHRAAAGRVVWARTEHGDRAAAVPRRHGAPTAGDARASPPATRKSARRGRTPT